MTNARDDDSRQTEQMADELAAAIACLVSLMGLYRLFVIAVDNDHEAGMLIILKKLTDQAVMDALRAMTGQDPSAGCVACVYSMIPECNKALLTGLAHIADHEE